MMKVNLGQKFEQKVKKLQEEEQTKKQNDIKEVIATKKVLAAQLEGIIGKAPAPGPAVPTKGAYVAPPRRALNIGDIKIVTPLGAGGNYLFFPFLFPFSFSFLWVSFSLSLSFSLFFIFFLFLFLFFGFLSLFPLFMALSFFSPIGYFFFELRLAYFHMIQLGAAKPPPSPKKDAPTGDAQASTDTEKPQEGEPAQLSAEESKFVDKFLEVRKARVVGAAGRRRPTRATRARHTHEGDEASDASSPSDSPKPEPASDTNPATPPTPKDTSAPIATQAKVDPTPAPSETPKDTPSVNSNPAASTSPSSETPKAAAGDTQPAPVDNKPTSDPKEEASKEATPTATGGDGEKTN